MKRAIILALIVAACGKQGELSRPVPPGTPKATTPPDPATLPSKLLERPTQAQPARIDDPLRRSTERPDDRFNLPPPG